MISRWQECNTIDLITLQIKLHASREALNALKKQHEQSESSRVALNSRVTELRTQLDAFEAQKTSMMQERDMLLKNADVARADKAALERSKIEMTAMVNALKII